LSTTTTRCNAIADPRGANESHQSIEAIALGSCAQQTGAKPV
jgi:hypothetical protein